MSVYDNVDKVASSERVTEQIKSCPLCGGKNIFILEKDTYEELIKENGDACMTIECADCNTETKVFSFHCQKRDYETMRAAILEKWNTRNGGNDNAD